MSAIPPRTVIGWPIPELAGSHSVHGAKLGTEGVAGLKKAVGFDPEQQFQVDEDVLAHTRGLAERAASAKAEWDKGYQAWRSANADAAALLDRLHRELDVTILYVSHEFGAVERFVERIVLVRAGIVFDGSPSELPGVWHDPSHVHP